MQFMSFIKPYRLTPFKELDSEVEHRNKFNLEFCELNVFETHQKAEDFHLKFDGLTITSMLRGKKVMRLEGMESFDYMPGETVLAARDQLMRIDFPTADRIKPTQCTALVIDEHYLDAQINRLKEHSKSLSLNENAFSLELSQPILKNNDQLASVSSRMINVLTSDDPFKNYEAELILKELVLCLIRLQNLKKVDQTFGVNANQSPINAIFAHVNNNLTGELNVDEMCKLVGMSKSSLYRMFTEQYGITPAQMVLQERLKFAKDLMCKEPQLKIKEIAYASGFNDPNYFNRVFKRQEGMTPVDYRLAGAAIA